MTAVDPPLPPEPPTRTDPSIVATLAAVKNSADPYTSRERHHNEGHGRRLTAAFEAMEAFPMLAESRNRVLRLFETGERSTADVVGAVAAERLRLHAAPTQRAADRIARDLGYESRDRLMVTSLLHDIGKLVLVHAYPGYPRQIHAEARTPDEG